MEGVPTGTEPMPLSGQRLLLKSPSLKVTLNKSKVRVSLMALETISSLSITSSRSLLKLMSIESVMPSSHLAHMFIPMSKITESILKTKQLLSTAPS